MIPSHPWLQTILASSGRKGFVARSSSTKTLEPCVISPFYIWGVTVLPNPSTRARDARNVSTVIVRVGLAVVMVGNVARCREDKRFLCSQQREPASTTQLRKSLPMLIASRDMVCAIQIYRVILSIQREPDPRISIAIDEMRVVSSLVREKTGFAPVFLKNKIGRLLRGYDPA